MCSTSGLIIAQCCNLIGSKLVHVVLQFETFLVIGFSYVL